MRVRMTKHITGYRNGEEWPQVGGEIDLPEGEAADMIANRYAEAAPEPEPAADPVDLNAKTVAELKQLAADRGVDLGDAKKKDDIVAALELAAEEAANAQASGDTGEQTPGPDGSDGAPAGETPDGAGEQGA